MLSLDQALEIVLAAAPVLETERVPLGEADGRVLAEPLKASAPLPGFDHSAMDGYALRIADLAGDPPWILPVVGESRAGQPAPSLQPGATCRIFTGAPIPPGADTVIIQENVERDGDRARIRIRPGRGEHVRLAGEDLPAGAIGLEAGTRLGPPQLALAAALDRADLLVRRRPHVIILGTGDELRPPGSPPRPGSIPESNSVAVAAVARRAGAAVRVAPAQRDDRESTERAIRESLMECDLLVTVGGVSVGDHDLVRPALESAGVRLDFWKVAIKPGKPLVLGRNDRSVVLGLPGNPVSAQVTFTIFGVPLLRKMQGDCRPVPEPQTARLGRAIRRKPGGRRELCRAVLREGVATPLESQSSGAVTSLAWANALIVIPEGTAALDAGAAVTVLRLDDV